MSETCIVCLGDLGESANDPPRPLLRTVKSPHDDHGRLVPRASTTPTPVDQHDDALIAHLLPCGHDLHNECLKPWVERANSCPICRQSFNQVELSARVGAPVTSTYAVNDRQQIADVDPAMVIEEDDEPEDRPCPVCGEDDNEEVLLECDGCGTYHHTYCVGLDEVPVGHWFCEECETQRAIESVNPSTGPERPPRRPHNTVDRRTRAQQRRLRNRNQISSSSWARVWQQVWDRLNLDLDFPFDDDSETARIDRAQRAESQRRDLQQWERRLQVGQRQGGRANRFRDTAPALLDLRARPYEHPQRPEPESREEIRAWNALEKAKEIDLDPTPKRKRKSATTSPSDADPVAQPERPLKRPRTRRLPGHIETASDTPSGSRRSSAAGPSSSRTPSAHNPPSRTNGPTTNGPSFLQSMLREIETSSAPDETKGQSHITAQFATGQNSPQTSSPGVSPTTSNHASPRARSTTPPPSIATRPVSPFQTSNIEPIFPPPEFSPTRSPPETSLSHRQRSSARQSAKERHSRPTDQDSSPPRSEGISPTRATMPFATKADLQRMVTAALKPHYQSNVVSKDQYTDINRNVSRMLYDKVGETGNVDGEERESWERLASDEVAKAVRSLQSPHDQQPQ